MYKTNLCNVCRHNITDPVCLGCYAKQIRARLNDLSISYSTNEFILNSLKKMSSEEGLNESPCILCSHEPVDVCYHCFSMRLIRILRKVSFSEDLIEDFVGSQISLSHQIIPAQD